MSDPKQDRLFEDLAAAADAAPEERAGTRLKSRIYTALVRRQAQSGPIESLAATKASGGALCVFEQLVQIAPVGERAKSVFICNTCHARILAEHLDNPAIWWPHCPYAEFQKP
ncbi:MAG: hypothetical protein ACRD96_10930 [Bryobacteraceae bacterium]